MMQRRASSIVLALGATVLLAGCVPSLTMEEVKAMRPERPPELDKLNAFAGNWEMKGEFRIAGLDELIEISGSAEAEWEADGWYLVSRFTLSPGELGDVQGQEMWTYDTHAKKYRNTWVDNMGAVGTGEARLDEEANTWHVRAISYGPMGKTTGKGILKVVDENTIEWTWTEYSGFVKTVEMTGTNKRR